jgi:hypothetical protein
MNRIIEVQRQIGVLGKDSKNPFFKSAYLDLNKLLIHVTPLLIENGLLLSQPIQNGFVKSLIIDAESGEVLLNSEIALPDLKDPQKLGSCITYFRRYTLKSLLAIAEGDDDGNLASKPEPKPEPKPKPKIEEFDFDGMIETFKYKSEIVKFSLEYDLTDLQKGAVKIKHKELLPEK